ncbi:MAG: hypothetical protein ACI8WB_001913 [Phenylobacterium sp.]
MSNPQIISTFIGLVIGSIIFLLVRRDHMVSKDGIRWLLVAAFIVVYSLFPSLNDLIGHYLGIGYPPIIPVLLGIGAILIKLLINDTERVKTRVDMERLIQRIAMLEAELEHEKLIRNNDNIQPLKVNSNNSSPVQTRSVVNHEAQASTAKRIEPVITELLDDTEKTTLAKVEPLKSVTKSVSGG